MSKGQSHSNCWQKFSKGTIPKKFMGLFGVSFTVGNNDLKELIRKAANIMILWSKDMNEIWQGKDFRARSNTCFKDGLIEHFIRHYTASMVDTADDTPPSVAAGKMQITVKADSAVMDGVIKLLFKKIINQNEIHTTKDKYCRTSYNSNGVCYLLLQKV